MPPQASDVGSLNRVAVSDVAGQGEVEDVRVRSFQFVVDAPGDGKSAVYVGSERRRHGKRPRRGAAQVLTAVCSLGKTERSSEAGGAVDILHSGRIALDRGQAERAVAIESIY